MAQLYVWKALNVSAHEAYDRFSQVLGSQCDLYTHAFGRAFTYSIQQRESIFIGQIQFDLGVGGWLPWVEDEGRGVAWSGVCEQFLGCGEAAVVDQVHAIVSRRPAEIAAWDGRFGLCTWQKQAQEVTLITSATDSPSFWYSDGPHGWAIGNRALPILELVGRRPALNKLAASGFITFGYLAGDTALLDNVSRLSPRHQITLTPYAEPKICAYISLEEYLDQSTAAPAREAIIREGAERVATRTMRQIKHSNKPELLLTGGRDSRWIAAAATHSGLVVKARTSGPKESEDVHIATLVARTIQLPHEHEIRGDHNSSIKVALDQPEKVQQWMLLSEGVETIRHALAFQGFFTGVKPFPALQHQVFHGLHAFGGLSTLNSNTTQKQLDLGAEAAHGLIPSILAPKTPEGLLFDAAVKDMLNQKLVHVYEDVYDLHPTLGQSLNLFYWQNRCEHWGADMMSVKDMIDWHWTPLFDRRLIQLFWKLDAHDKFSKRFIKDATLYLAPVLKQVEYDKNISSEMSFVRATKRFVKKLKRNGQKVLHHTTEQTQSSSTQHLRAFWKQVLFDSRESVWPELIDEAALHRLVDQKPADETLWNVATVELFAQACLGSLRTAVKSPWLSK